WFGDFRKVLADQEDPLFCIDLRFWYPSRAFGYEKRSAAGLKNREGEAVAASKLRRMAFALWRHRDADDQPTAGALELYRPAFLGDAAPGEVATDAAGPAVQRRIRAVAREADKYAGPYKVETKLSDKLQVGVAGSVTTRVLAASGAAVPDVTVR